ncbi:MAG: response regulator [Lachnospira sp.]
MGEEIRSCAGKCVLVVDDNEFNRELVREILEDEAITVYESDDGKSAVDFMDKAQGADVDVILMDVRMPVMDGFMATKLIREKGGYAAKVPIIAMTANAFESDRKEAQNNGMDGLIAKPVDVETMVSQIAELAGW